MKKFILILTAIILSIVTLNNGESSSLEGTGGIEAISERYWCKHTEAEKPWIHDIQGSIQCYVGDVAFKNYMTYYKESTKDMSSDEAKEFFTVIDFFRFEKLDASEVSSLLDQVNADCLVVNDPAVYSEEVRQEILNELFGDNIKNITKVDVYYKVKEGTMQGLIFGTESVDDISASGGTVENSLPRGVVGYVGIKNYNSWFTNLKDKKDYTIQKFLKDFNVPVDVYDDAIYYASLQPDSIYTQDVYDKVRKEIYGSTKKIEEVPVVSSEEIVVSKTSSEWAEYYII